MSKIITIGREFGSGGRELGRRLAEELGAEYYDKEIITEISKKTSLSEEYVKNVVEKTPHHLYPITIGQSISLVENYYMKQIQSVYSAQANIIREMAEMGNCVIVGRCADYILKDQKPFRIFVYADMESRIRRSLERAEEPMSEKEMKKYIRMMDKNRAKYYEYYTGRTWGDKENYNLCLNTTDCIIKEVVPHIAKMF